MPLFNIDDRIKSYTHPEDVPEDHNGLLGTIKEIGSGNRANQVRLEIDDYPAVVKWQKMELVTLLPQDGGVVTGDDIGDVIGGDDVVVNVGGRKRKSRKRRKKRRKSRKRRKTKKKRRKRKRKTKRRRKN